MNIILNGEPCEIPESIALGRLLQDLDYEPVRVAVALNLEFVPRSAYADTRLKDSDQVEIVAAVSGG